jgi:DNA topoisomerase-3
MGMTLIIAEKPSVAKSIAAVLGATIKKDGYLEGGGYFVSWCVGHLAELADAAVYDERYSKWRLEDLPILPENWRFVLGKDTRKQFDILRGLLRAPEVETVVNACDAGREGELIFRTVYHLAGCTKPMKRLWISSMEDEAIRQGFKALRNGADYDGLHQSALCRAKADWLVGINATRLFSVLYRRTLNVGRVMTPTLALLVQREAEIDAFKPKPFYNVVLTFSDFAATGERLATKAEATAIQEACTAADIATVKAVAHKERREKPPALYDLTTLQREANRLLGFTAQQTLDYLQSLYEMKLCTYPRTDSRYLTTDMAPGLPVLVDIVAKAIPFAAGITIHTDVEQVINNSKVTDHHAIIPTQAVRDADLATLPSGERAVLRLVATRLLCAVGQPYEYAETTVTVECAGHSFTAKGCAILNPGWRVMDGRYRAALKDKPVPDKDSEAKTLPAVSEGQTFAVVTAAIKEGKTTPPTHFTEDSLLAAMETAGAKEMPEDAERKGLGTPATRAGILEKLVSTGFVERKKTKKTVNLLPTHAGVALITVLPEQIQSPTMTAEWEHQLKQIERGETDPDAFLDGIAILLRELTHTYEAVKGAAVLFPDHRETVGRCPRCGGAVTEGKKGFTCENPDCRFALWKNNKFFSIKKKELTRTVAVALLKDGRASLTGCYSEKTGKSYDAMVLLDDDGGQYVNFKLEFAARGPRR